MSLFPHQREAVEFVLARGSAVLCYEMGLGKTFIGLGVARHFKVVFVFLPAYLRSAWIEAAGILGVECPHFVSYDARKFPLVPAEALVILDESQYIKNKNSARWKRLERAIVVTSHRLLLTGTPMLNRHAELWTQLKLMGYTQSWTAFTREFCGARERWIRGRRVWDTSRSTHAPKLRHILKAHGFRFRDKGILGTLPPKTTTVVPFTMLPCHGAGVPGNCLSQYQQSVQRRIQSPSWRDTIRATAEPPAIIFAKHIAVLDALHELFPDAKRIDGTHRDEIPTSGILLCSIGAAAVGLTLTFATKCIFAECSWSAGVQAQCEARIHRIGQTRPCQIIYVLSDDIVDRKIWASIQRKQKHIRKLSMRTTNDAPSCV